MLSAFRRPSLTLILLFGVSLEMLLHRLATNLVSKRFVLADPLTLGGNFAHHFVAVLALAMAAWATFALIRERETFPLYGRLALLVSSAVFIPLATIGSFVPLAASLRPHINTSFALLLVALVVGFVARPAPLRAKVGVLYLVTPLFLHCYWLAAQQIPGLGPIGDAAGLPSRLFEAGEHMVVVGAFSVFLFFAPHPRLVALTQPLPLALGLLVTGTAAVLMINAYPLAHQAAYHGLGINLPPFSLQGAIHLVALFFFVVTIVALALRPGLARATAAGLALIGASGFQLTQPYQFLVTAIGIIVLMRAAMAEQQEVQLLRRQAEASTPSEEQLSRYLERCADALSLQDADIVALDSASQKLVHLRAVRHGQAVIVRLAVGAGTIDELEIIVGEPPKDHPEASLLRTRARRGKRIGGYRGRKSEYDPHFVLRDGGERISERLTDAALRNQLLRSMHGLLAIWPDESVVYLARPVGDGWPVPLAEIAFDAEGATLDDLKATVEMVLAAYQATRAGEG